jgi:hypothetical protein
MNGRRVVSPGVRPVRIPGAIVVDETRVRKIKDPKDGVVLDDVICGIKGPATVVEGERVPGEDNGQSDD